VEDGHPLSFMSDMERRPDFTFANEAAVHKIMQTACEKASEVAENNAQLKRLKKLCEELFPLGDEEFITLNLEKVDGPSKRRPNPLEPIVLEQNGDFTVVDGTLKVAPGSVVWVTFRYRGTNKFTSDVKLDPLTSRGATLKVLPQEFAEQLPGIEVAQKKVYDEIVKGEEGEK
jgi:hypothetical protein